MSLIFTVDGLMIETERLIIRPFTADGLNSLLHLYSNKEVMQFSVKGPITNIETVKTILNGVMGDYAKDGYSLFACTLKSNNAFMGYTGFMNQVIDGDKYVELGYRLLPEFWGKGYATEAAISLIEYGFRELRLPEIISIIDPANEKSVKVAERAGLTFFKESKYNEIPVNIYRITNGNN